MSVILRHGKPASEPEIVSLERALGYRISKLFRQFVAAYDGARPETNSFRISEGNDSGITEFIRIAKINEERNRLRPLPAQAYPIAWAEGGNYVVIDEGAGGAVFFWDHETQIMTWLAADFDGFLQRVLPFDPKSVQLKPEQIKKLWIDPEFLKRMKNK